MYSRNIIWGAVLGLMILASACTSTRYYTSSEYDDVYYNTSDDSGMDNPVVNNGNTEAGNGNTYSGTPTYTAPDNRNNRSYNDYYYADDDFHFSRRIRRFNNIGTGFRYYDPFFTNDLYYVIGTPAWGRWNSRGWYSWNNPRFGVSWGYNPGWDPFFYQGFYNPYVYNPWNTVNYYNPWVVSYYGYAPTYGFSGFGGWGNPGWSTFGGWGGGFGGYAYCPPSYYRNGTFNNSRNAGLGAGNYTRYRQAHRSSPGMVASRPGSGTRTSGVRDRIKPRAGAPVESTRATVPTRTRSTGGIDYLRPSTNRTPTVRTNRTPGTPSVNAPRTAPRRNPRVYTAPGNQPQREATPSTRTPSRQPRVAPTRTPRQTPSRNNNVRRNRNNGTTPSASPRRSPNVNPGSTPRVRPNRTPRVSPSRSRTPSRTVTPRPSVRPRSSGGNRSGGSKTRVKRN